MPSKHVSGKSRVACGLTPNTIRLQQSGFGVPRLLSETAPLTITAESPGPLQTQHVPAPLLRQKHAPPQLIDATFSNWSRSAP